uniref:Beta-microseminoprotein n=1 Tax=Doryteuthis pealeii TaxID=1051067 RepID=MSMB_DORPE
SCSRKGPKFVEYKYMAGSAQYCEHKNMKFMIGSNFIDFDDCTRCTCYNHGLQCCGIGANAGVFGVPGCEAVNDHCELVFLKKNTDQLCFIN